MYMLEHKSIKWRRTGPIDLNEHKIDTCAIFESKRKRKWTIDYPDTTFIYKNIDNKNLYRTEVNDIDPQE